MAEPLPKGPKTPFNFIRFVTYLIYTVVNTVILLLQYSLGIQPALLNVKLGIYFLLLTVIGVLPLISITVMNSRKTDHRIRSVPWVGMIVKLKVRPQKKELENSALKSLYVLCWDHEPDKRPTMKEVIEYLENMHVS